MSEASEATEAQILVAVSQPKSVMVDGVSMTQHSLPELIALDKHNTAKAAARTGIKFQKIVPPAAV